MKQAYLIIAHNKMEQLKFLISLLDYEKHDIYILFDQKAKIPSKQKKELKQVVKKSSIFFTKEISIYWGDYSLVEAELKLFETASKQDEYSIYHLLSGVDLPLDTAENIFNFFDSRKENNFLTMVSDNLYRKNNIYERVAYQTFLPNLSSRSVDNIFFKKGINLFRKIEVDVQRFLKIDLFKKYHLDLRYASNWCSLNQKSVDKILEEKELIKTVFKRTKVSDELFVPTILEKHNLLENIYSSKPTNDYPTDFQGNLRYINWWDGSPYTWTDSPRDFEQLKFGKKQGHLFSRKFDLEKYPEMAELIEKIIHMKAEEL